MQLDKKGYTKLFLENANTDSSIESIKQHLLLWWVAPFGPKGLRLTREGVTFAIEQVKLTPYKFKVTSKPNNLKFVIQLSSNFTSPFYLGNSIIIVFSESDAMMLGLYNGDIGSYMNSFD